MFTQCKHVRKRNLPFPVDDYKIRERSWLSAGFNPPGWYLPAYQKDKSLHPCGTQVTESDSNPWPLPKDSGKEDLGSEFFSQKFEWVSPSVLPYSIVNVYDGTPPTNIPHWQIEGTLIANCFDVKPFVSGEFYSGEPAIPLKVAWPPDMSSSRHDLEVLGTRAVALCSPGNQVAAAASFVGELMQDVPRIPGIALWESRLRALGTVAAGADEFLNYIFGIAPTIGDMGDFLKGAHKVDKLVDQLIRDAGKVVRRRFYFPKEKSVTETVLPRTWSPAGWGRKTSNPTYGACFTGATNSGYALPVRETTRVRVVEREQWFSGAFTYYLPSWYDNGSERDRKRLMAKLFGASPDLNTLWQLAPWSWAVDWFSNAGSFVQNLNSLHDYGTILRYGYIMETTTVTDTFTASGPYSPVGLAGVSQPYPYVTPVILRVTTKKRVAANPFGFGVSWDSLSSVQQAIAAALGITRVVR